MTPFPPDHIQHQTALVALLRAERRIEPVMARVMDDWLEATRFVVLREVGQTLGLTAAGYSDPSPAVDAATQAYNVWRRGVDNELLPEIGIAFGEAYRQIRAGSVPQRYEAEYLATVNDRLKIWPEGAFDEIRPELIEAIAEGESYDEITERVGRVLGIDAETRELKARIREIEARLQDEDDPLDKADRRELAAEWRRLWDEHDESLGKWQWKARRIARTEIHGATEAARMKAAEDAAYTSGEKVFKRWRATHDLRVRATHKVADGQVVPLGDKFQVGEHRLRFPGDPLGAAPHETINCRCTVSIYSDGMVQDGLQGPNGSLGEVQPGGVRLGPDDPDTVEKAVDDVNAGDLDYRTEPETPIVDPEIHWTAQMDLADLDDDALIAVMEQAHDNRDDDLWEAADAEWERRSAASDHDGTDTESTSPAPAMPDDIEALSDDELLDLMDKAIDHDNVYAAAEAEWDRRNATEELSYTPITTPPGRLTEAEISYLESYALGGHQRVNEALRGQRPMTPSIQQSIDALRTALNKYPLPSPVRVTRSIPPSAIGFDSDSPDLIVGAASVQAGFLSTSMKENPGVKPGHVILDLVVPEGVPAFALGSLAEFPLETELLVIDARKIRPAAVSFDEKVGAWRIYGVVEVEEES